MHYNEIKLYDQQQALSSSGKVLSTILHCSYLLYSDNIKHI
jgi:hypothetical protein